MNRYITDEQRDRRLIFKATLRAGASWLFFRVARSTRMIQISALRSRLGKQPAALRRHHYYLRACAYLPRFSVLPSSPTLLLSVMQIITPVMRSRGIWEDSIVSDVILDHTAYVKCDRIKARKNLRWTGAQVAQDRNHRDTQHVIAKPPSVWPSARHCSFTKTLLNRAREGISPENTKSIKHLGLSGCLPNAPGRSIDPL